MTQANSNSGAGITLLAGVGANGPAYAAFAEAYLNPAGSSLDRLAVNISRAGGIVLVSA